MVWGGASCFPTGDNSGEPGSFEFCLASCPVVSEEVCGNGVDEDCDGVVDSCVCVHDADLEPCDGVVSVGELGDYLDRWLIGGVSIGEVMGAIGEWVSEGE